VLIEKFEHFQRQSFDKLEHFECTKFCQVGSRIDKFLSFFFFFQILSLVHDWVVMRYRASDEALTHDDWTILTNDWPGPRSSLLSTEPLGDLPWMLAWDSDVSSPIVTWAWDSDVSWA
jgi:hypothetical protein